MPDVSETVIDNIGKVLNDPARPLKERFRALFTLKNLGGGNAINHISHCFKDDSALLKHELAYCLGQMQDVKAIPILIRILEAMEEHPMVRHEAAEALGAIGKAEVKDVLKKYINDSSVEVAETCEIALNRLEWLSDGSEAKEVLSESTYKSVDPAPPSVAQDVAELTKVFLDEEKPLFERYRAMFSLRNLGTTESINALGKGLKVPSALFKHEVAFVFGQMQDVRSIPFLKESLEDVTENEMVRHEAAEALGAIATEECNEILKRYLEDEKRVVRESCIVALDMSEYENSPEFQYANTLTQVAA